MRKTYKEALLDPNIPFDILIDGLIMPEHLYKYQSFYSMNGEENKYWKDNISGAFHLSLGSEFEDKNDCKPYINKAKVCEIVANFISTVPKEKIYNELNAVLTREYYEQVISSYQNTIRIGCFTKSSNNPAMWKKYSNDETGFCIEYSVKRNDLFRYSTLPVLYSDRQHDSSLTLAGQIILEGTRQAKGRSQDEQIDVFKSIYAKILKDAYIPVFIKEKDKWSFEEEYRMFLLQHRNTQVGMLEASKILDVNSNIDLSNAVTAIYLGRRFENNEKHEEILAEIIRIVKAKKRGIKVFQKDFINGEYRDKVIL